MNHPARVAYVGDTDTLETIECDLGGRMTFVPVDSHGIDDIDDGDDIDCRLCVGSLPGACGETPPPTIVLTDEEETARKARLAGLRVLPREIIDRPDALLAQIDATIGESRVRASNADGRLVSTIATTVEDIIYAFDEEGLVYWNDRLPEVTGIDDDELVSMHPVDLFSGEDADRLAAIINDYDPTNLPVTIEMELPGPDGRTTPYEFTNSRLIDSDGTAIGVCGVGRNVTEYKRTTRTLEQLLEGTRDLMAANGKQEVAGVAVSTVNDVLGLAHTGICFVDETGEGLEPVAYTDTVERSLETVPTLERGESLAWEIFESGEDRVFDNVHEEERAHNPDTHLRSELIFSLGDHGVLIIGSKDPNVFEDVDLYFVKLLAATATVALDRADRESELEAKNAQLEEFVGVVSHDLRNPLNVAGGSVALAIETGDWGHLHRIEESHRRMNEIIEGLLVLAREGRAVGETRPVIVGTVAEEAWTTVETGGSTLVVGDDRVVHADRNRLRQLFENAFRNSVEHRSTDSQNASRSGDSVEHGSTSSQPRADDSVEHSSMDNGPEAGVTVTVEATTDGFAIGDDGPGIPAAERDALLNAGFGSKGGFGVPIMRSIAEGHGWGISLVESDSGGLRIEISTNENGHSAGEQ